MDKIDIREMNIRDYDEVIELWESTKGIGLSDADSKENIEMFLNRNPGLSLVAQIEDKIIGAVLCGHDGRRGFLHHFAIRKEYRRKGLGKKMTEECLERLKAERIQKCHLFIFTDNELGIKFWTNTGWTKRNKLHIYSKSTF